ncbi:HAD family hydrolase [Streptomyces sp. NPDC087460]|uniref:HAD family hydrolase n=1 Tax=Streptomyces sp. NPDC087460 TaxID=3365791 RepID=UPI00380C859B
MTTVATRTRPALAFFDVDETVIAAKSMIAFWDHWMRRHPAWAAARAPWSDAGAAAPVDRAELNRRHYRRYAGVPLATLQAAGRLWYDGYRRGEAAFVRPVVDAVAAHWAAGCEVVLVSGSMRPLLTPLARDVGASTILCTELVVGADGVLTGEVHRPMIGDAKAEAAVGLMRERGVDAGKCFAYGDHESDLALLRSVGKPVVVGDSPLLHEAAQRYGWPVTPARPGPLRADSP